MNTKTETTLSIAELEIKFTLALRDISLSHRQIAEAQAKEAYIMALLKMGDISSGRAARLLGISRLEVLSLMNKYQISPLADLSLEELQDEVEQSWQIMEKNR